MPATNGSATPSVAATSSEATAPPVPTATGCFVIKTALAVAAGLAAAGLAAAQLSTIAPAADSANKPFRVDLIDFLPGAGREGVALFGHVRLCGQLNIKPTSSRTASAACRSTGRASRS